MRKILLSLNVLALTVLAGAAVTSGAHAAPMAGPIPVLEAPAHVQSVQYYDDWRRREWIRRERFEAWRRHEERRRWHHGHGYGEGYGRW